MIFECLDLCGNHGTKHVLACNQELNSFLVRSSFYDASYLAHFHLSFQRQLHCTLIMEKMNALNASLLICKAELRQLHFTKLTVKLLSHHSINVMEIMMLLFEIVFFLTTVCFQFQYYQCFK